MKILCYFIYFTSSANFSLDSSEYTHGYYWKNKLNLFYVHTNKEKSEIKG